jgi:hypothetical protein
LGTKETAAGDLFFILIWVSTYLFGFYIQCNFFQIVSQEWAPQKKQQTNEK